MQQPSFLIVLHPLNPYKPCLVMPRCPSAKTLGTNEAGPKPGGLPPPQGEDDYIPPEDEGAVPPKEPAGPGPITPPGGPKPIIPGGPILPPGANATMGPNATSTMGPGPIIPPGGPILPPMLPGAAGANATGPNTTSTTTPPGGPIITPPSSSMPLSSGNRTNEAGPASTSSSSSGATGGGQVGTMSEFEQCGGAGGDCKKHGDSACADAVFAGKGCSAGLECVRQSFFYRQCLKPDVVKNLGSAWVTTAPAARADCPKGFIGFQLQCGGSGGSCKENPQLGGACADAAAAGACCEPGTTCQRVNEWFWQCAGQPTNSAPSN